MIDYPYVGVQLRVAAGADEVARRYPKRRAGDVQGCQARSRILLSIQKPEGLVRELGGVLHLRHVVRDQGLIATDTYDTCPALRKAVAFLLSTDALRRTGRATSRARTKYVQLTTKGTSEAISHVVNTAWATLALVASGQATRDPAPLHRAAPHSCRRSAATATGPSKPSWASSTTTA